ncbi:MAG: UbiA family prenyltransferase [Hyphomonadaceae bacterium]
MSGSGQVEGAAQTNLPLAVDLDGTLIHTDLFIEGLVRVALSKPWKLPMLAGAFMRGRANAKARIFELITVDAPALPYDERVLAWLREEKRRGRTLVLASACDRAAVQQVADHLALFDAVMASDGHINLKSRRKAEKLAGAFPGGFVYAGNESADIAVWRAASRAVVANASAGLSRRAHREFDVERAFPREAGAPRALLAAIRPQQWSKNLLVFLPMLAGQGWALPAAWTSALLAFGGLSFTASAVYLLNDAADIDADRAHPRKKRRPFASGALALPAGLAAALALTALGLALAAQAGVLELTLIYAALTCAYTFWLKRVVLADVAMLATLYTIRIVLGGAATGFLASDWLLAFSCFFFLGLALVKRVAETRDLAQRGGGKVGGRGYRSTDAMALTIMGVGAGMIAMSVLALYLLDEANAAHYKTPALLWGLPVAGIIWTSRVWLKVSRGEMDDDPILFALRDKYSWLLALAASLCFFGAATLPL